MILEKTKRIQGVQSNRLSLKSLSVIVLKVENYFGKKLEPLNPRSLGTRTQA
jgi:hypothetical protein